MNFVEIEMMPNLEKLAQFSRTYQIRVYVKKGCIFMRKIIVISKSEVSLTTNWHPINGISLSPVVNPAEA